MTKAQFVADLLVQCGLLPPHLAAQRLGANAPKAKYKRSGWLSGRHRHNPTSRGRLSCSAHLYHANPRSEPIDGAGARRDSRRRRPRCPMFTPDKPPAQPFSFISREKKPFRTSVRMLQKRGNEHGCTVPKFTWNDICLLSHPQAHWHGCPPHSPALTGHGIQPQSDRLLQIAAAGDHLSSSQGGVIWGRRTVRDAERRQQVAGGNLGGIRRYGRDKPIYTNSEDSSRGVIDHH